MKTTKDKVYSKLAAARTNLKSNKVALGLVDDFSYGDTQSLEEEVGRLSYSVEEWFDEKFDEWYEIGRDIYSVYFQNSEAFLTPADVAQDENVLSQIKEKAEELGLSAEDVYPEWQEHKDLLVYLEELQEKFESQKQRFSDESRSI
tara:strand:+ start:109 stop:546 length:438 start_codon:yes stop_codon:yes gene_type:complete